MAQRLSENFDLVTDKFWPADAGAIDAKSLYKLWLIVQLILQPVRTLFGPVIVTSGKRTEATNTREKGAKNSHHLMNGESVAVDFVVKDGIADINKRLAVFKWIMDNRMVAVKELIWYQQGNWIHVAFCNAEPPVRVQFKNLAGEYISLGTDSEAACATIKRQDHRFGASRAVV